MKAIAERTASVGCRWLAVSLFLFGCAGGGGTSTDPTDPLPTKEVLTKRIDDELKVRAVDYGDEHTKVALRDRQGRAVFSVESMPGDGDQLLLTTTMSLAQSADSEADTYTEQLEIERGEGESSPLEDQLIATLILHGQYAQALLGNYATQDSQGCDIAKPGPGALGIDWVNVASCSRKGACCEQHDACYQKYQCTADSWSPGKGSKACKACNKLATQCVFSNAAPGPAPCCATGSCGVERGPTWMDGDPIPAFPNPATKTGLDPSLGIGGRRGSPVRAVDTTGDGAASEAADLASDDVSPAEVEPGVETGYESDEEEIGSDALEEPDQSLDSDEPDGAQLADDEADSSEPSAEESDLSSSGAEDEEAGFSSPDEEDYGDEESDFAGPDEQDYGDEESDFAGPDEQDYGDEESDFADPDEEDYGDEDSGEQEFADANDYYCDAYGC